jgi:hypothetical protein
MPTSDEWLKDIELSIETAEARRDTLSNELNIAQKEYEIWKEALKMARGIALAVAEECATESEPEL